MPLIGAVLLAINVALVVHTVKTGRFWPWAYVILMIPVAGAIAYVVVELVPEWLGTHKAQTARRRIGKALNPEKTYRALQDQVDIADTIANRDALAQECLSPRPKPNTRPSWRSCSATIPALRWAGRRPSSVSAGSRMPRRLSTICASAGPTISPRRGISFTPAPLEEDGRLEEAAEEYHALSGYYAGAEPRVRYGLLLRKLGRETEARAALTEVVRQMRRAPQFARKVQAEWIAMAEAALRG